MQIFLNQYITHYLNRTLTTLASYGDKNISTINRLYISQKKALRIINFKQRNAHSSPFFHYSKIIKIKAKVKIQHRILINKYTNNELSSIFTNWFTFSSMSHNFKTVFASKGNVQIPDVQKTLNGKKQPYHQRTFQPYHQRLREYRFYVNIGSGVNIGCDRCFYIMLLTTRCIAFNNQVY